MSSIEVVDHNLFILLHSGEVSRTRVCPGFLLVPHLQRIDYLSDVVARAFNQLACLIVVEVEALCLSHTLHKISNLNDGRPHEFKIVAVVDQRGELLRLPIVADADDGSSCHFDDPDQGCDAASVASAYSIYLVHDDDRLLRGKPTKDSSVRILVVLSLLDARHAEVVDALVATQIFDAAFDRSFVSGVGSILLHNFEAELGAHDSCCTRFSDAWRPTE